MCDYGVRTCAHISSVGGRERDTEREREGERERERGMLIRLFTRPYSATGRVVVFGSYSPRAGSQATLSTRE